MVPKSPARTSLASSTVARAVVACFALPGEQRSCPIAWCNCAWAVTALSGRAGLIPFLAPGLAGWLWPAIAPLAGSALAAYGALILSFLAGARWGMAVAAPSINNRIVSLAMLPSLTGFALILPPPEWRGWQLAGLAAAYILQGYWDLGATTVPTWHASLRGQLTFGALTGLAAGLAIFGT